MYFIMFILGAISMFMMVCIGYAAKQEEPKNRVHFYVARDKNGSIWLYLGKPIRKENEFSAYKRRGRFLFSSYQFKDLGLNIDDYKDLKWEDEPKKVFLNLED